MDTEKLTKILAAIAAEHDGLDLKIREDGLLEARYFLDEVGVYVDFMPDPAMRAFGASFAFVQYETPPSVVDADPHHLRDIAGQLDWLLLRVDDALVRAHELYYTKQPEQPAARAHASNRETVRRTRIQCADGHSISVQASAFHYSQPRDNRFHNIWLYDAVECGYPETRDGEVYHPAELEAYREQGDSSVYPYTPIGVVAAFVHAHGGAVSGGEIDTNY